MLILGVDPSQKTGFAYFDSDRSISAMRAGLVKAPQGRDVPIEDKASAIAREICLMLRAERPDMIAIEEPMRMLPVGGKRKVKFIGEEQQVEASGGGASALISSNQIVGAIVAVCAVKAIPFVTISSGTWRKHWLGFGRRQGWERADWKRAARQRCASLGITVTNDDSAEACGVAFAATSTDTYRMMMHQQSQQREQAA